MTVGQRIRLRAAERRQIEAPGEEPGGSGLM